jgi:hypothetical protein
MYAKFVEKKRKENDGGSRLSSRLGGKQKKKKIFWTVKQLGRKKWKNLS